MADYSNGTQPGRFLVAPPARRACVYRPHSPPPESDQRGSPEGRGRDPRRRSVTGNMASKAKKRAVGNGVQRPLEAPSQREEEEEDELEDEEEDDEDSEEEEDDEDDEIVDEVRGTRDHIFWSDLRGKPFRQPKLWERDGRCGEL